MPIENIGFIQANTLPGPQAESEPGATPAPRQQKNDARVGSHTPNLPQLLQAKAPARPAPPAHESIALLSLANQTQTELATMNQTAQAQAAALNAGVEGTKALLEASKEAAKSLTEAARKV